jgi:ketosteroid isomerase-like protein
MPRRSPEVERVVRDWLVAKQAADGPAIREGLSGYEGAVAIGTDASEWWVGAAVFAEAHAAGGGFSATIKDVEAHEHGSVAWAAVRATVETGEPGGMAIRLTLVLVREDDGRWRVVHSHASAPDAGSED